MGGEEIEKKLKCTILKKTVMKTSEKLTKDAVMRMLCKEKTSSQFPDICLSHLWKYTKKKFEQITRFVYASPISLQKQRNF